MKLFTLFLFVSLSAFAASPPKPELQITIGKDFANICLAKGEGFVFEVQRKGRGLSKWKTIGLLPAGVPCFQDHKPPANSRWRVRALVLSGEKGPFSDVMP